MRLWLVLLIVSLTWPSIGHAQGTGASFPTPNSSQTVPGTMVMAPCGPIVNGQPTACPTSGALGLPVTCVNCSPSAPVGASSNPVNGTIAGTNVFQTLIAQNSSRRGCNFQNQGSHIMYFSVAASPTLANSQQVPPQGTYNCGGTTNVVITDLIQITGTSGDAFAGQWQ